MREPRNTQNTRNNGEVESGGVWSGGVDFNTEARCARDEVVGLPERSEPEGPQGAARRRGWEVRRVKTILQPHKKLVGKHCNKYDLLSLTLRGVVKRDMENPEGKFPASFETYQEVLPGDFIFCMFDNEETPRAVGLSNLRGMITGAYDVMSVITEDVNHNFLNYYLLYIDNGKRLKPLYKGLRKTVPLDSFLSYKIPLPPLSEQRAIVKYLDAETGRIDKAIAAEEKMIALLQERREIVINEAVSGSGKCGSDGIDFNAEARCARDEVVGLPELSEPEGPQGAARRRGWEVRYGKSIFTENKRKNKMLENKTILSLSYGKIIVKSSPDSGLVPAEYSGYQLLSPGDIVIRCTDLQNDQKSQRIGFVEVGGIITSAYLGLKVNDGINSRYIAYWLKNWDATKEIYRYGSGLRQSLSWVDLKYLPIPLPPLSEQEEIVKYLDVETGRIDRAIEVKRRQIELLRERRQIVIDEVVTGKVKVA